MHGFTLGCWLALLVDWRVGVSISRFDLKRIDNEVHEHCERRMDLQALPEKSNCNKTLHQTALSQNEQDVRAESAEGSERKPH
jgi:hypothetical protein